MQEVPQLSQNLITPFARLNSSNNNAFDFKLSIEFYDNNFLLWNQQVDGVILTNKMQNLWLTLKFPPKLKMKVDRQAKKTFNEYVAWVV